MLRKTESNITLLVLFSATFILFAGCENVGSGISEEAEIVNSKISNTPGIAGAKFNEQFSVSIQSKLAELRRATAPYHNIDKAIKADYDTPLTPCWYNRESGAMGYHYGDLTLLDNNVELLAPEALMYEPGPTGHYRLVGMEYIVPIAAWEGEEVPTLLGQNYHPNEALGLYTLHVWLWKENPNGMFAAWNPRVSCKYAEESEDRAGL